MIDDPETVPQKWLAGKTLSRRRPAATIPMIGAYCLG
jgi:hypothetical protein